MKIVIDNRKKYPVIPRRGNGGWAIPERDIFRRGEGIDSTCRMHIDSVSSQPFRRVESDPPPALP